MPLVRGHGTVPLTKDVFIQGLVRLGYAGLFATSYFLLPTSYFKDLCGRLGYAGLLAPASYCLLPSYFLLPTRYTGPVGMLSSLFKRIDSDKSGVLGFMEVREWMTGRMRRKTMAHSIHLMWQRNDSVTLKTIEWSAQACPRVRLGLGLGLRSGSGLGSIPSQ